MEKLWLHLLLKVEELKIAAVKAQGLVTEEKAMLEDIAILTGATVISEERGFNLETRLLKCGTSEN